MTFYERMKLNNLKWSKMMTSADPDYFKRLAEVRASAIITPLVVEPLLHLSPQALEAFPLI